MNNVKNRDTNGNLVLAFHYDLNANGLKPPVTKELPGDIAETTGFTYDALQRLETVT